MKRDEIVRILREHRADFDQFGVNSLSIFGSVARDEAGEDSDLDVLVEFDGPTRFLAYMGLKFQLEELLHRRVDLATPKMIGPEIAVAVQRDLLRETPTTGPSA